MFAIAEKAVAINLQANMNGVFQLLHRDTSTNK